VRGAYFGLLTLASAVVFQGVFNSWDFVGSSVGILILFQDKPLDYFFMSKVPYYYIVVGLVILGLAVTALVRRSKFGFYLAALRENEDAAEASGVPTLRCKVQVMALSAFFTALGGTFYAQYFLYIQPDVMFAFDPQLTMMIGTMVGGSGTVFGPLIGSLFYAAFSEGLRNLAGAGNSREAAVLVLMFWGLVLTFIVMYLPGGLLELRRLGRRRPRVAPRIKPAGDASPTVAQRGG
jgi:branched-chain amino acid transport system permease protein